jgi:hypothetical protein
MELSGQSDVTVRAELDALEDTLVVAQLKLRRAIRTHQPEKVRNRALDQLELASASLNAFLANHCGVQPPSKRPLGIGQDLRESLRSPRTRISSRELLRRIGAALAQVTV